MPPKKPIQNEVADWKIMLLCPDKEPKAQSLKDQRIFFCDIALFEDR